MWAPTAGDAAIPFSIDQTFSPFEDALASVSWAGSNSIVVGGESNATLSLWSLSDGEEDMMGAECVQTLTLAASAGPAEKVKPAGYRLPCLPMHFAL
jgi:hypothetical protein